MDTKRRFKLNRHHLQGAMAMLLVVVIVFSSFYLSGFGGFPFGTMFRSNPDAVEKTAYANPGTVEARLDFQERFTLTGLPAEDLSKITAESVFLGGYFNAFSVNAVEFDSDKEALIVFVGQASQPFGESEEIDWQRYSGDEGLIAISPDAFSDQSYYYQAAVHIIYPSLTSDTRYIALPDDGYIDEQIMLTLSDDQFVRTPTPQDITVTGGITGTSVANLSLSGNRITFVLTGVCDPTLEDFHLIVSGGVMEKGLDTSVFIRKGFAPRAEQSSPLYAMNGSAQTLDIFVANSFFSDAFSPSMLQVSGALSGVSITDVETVSPNTVRLTLAGSFTEGTGMIIFDSRAIESEVALTAEIEVAAPQVYVRETVFLPAQDPVMTVRFDDMDGFNVDDLYFTLGGSLAELSVSYYDPIPAGVELYLSGTAESGEATLAVSGLFDAAVDFEVMCAAPAEEEEKEEEEEEEAEETEEEDGESEDGETAFEDVDEDTEEESDESHDEDEEADDVDAETGEADQADGNADQAAGDADQADGNADQAAGDAGGAAGDAAYVVGAASSLVYLDANLVPLGLTDNISNDMLNKAITFSASGALSLAGFPGASKAAEAVLPVALGLLGLSDPDPVQVKLDIIIDMLNDVLDKISDMQHTLIAKFDELEYKLKLQELMVHKDAIDLYAQHVQDALDLVDGESRDRALRFNLDIWPDSGSVCEAGTFETHLAHILTQLDPMTKGNLTQCYLRTVEANVPFKHNITELMNAYVTEWSALCIQYKTLYGLVCSYNADKYPDAIKGSVGINTFAYDLDAMEERINVVLQRMSDYIPDDCNAALAWFSESEPFWATCGILYEGDSGKGNRNDYVDYPGMYSVNRMTVVTNNSNAARYHFATYQERIFVTARDGKDMGFRLITRPYDWILEQNPGVAESPVWYRMTNTLWRYKLPHAHGGSWRNWTSNAGYRYEGQGEYGGETFELFEGSNSLYVRYGAGMSFNRFMHTFTDDAADTYGVERWWDPDYLFMGYYNTDLIFMRPKASGFEYDSFGIGRVLNTNQGRSTLVGIDGW